MKFNLSEFDALIHRRRSIFPEQYTGEVIDRDVVRRILEHATCAPTHKRTEPWRFSVFMGKGLARLASLQSACYKTVTEADGTYKEERYQGLRNKPFKSACVIAIGMKRDERKSVPEVEEIGAVFCALENIYLSTAAHGLAGYFSTGGVTYFEQAKALFGLGPGDRLLGFFNLGVPKEWSPAHERKPVDTVTQWIME